MFFEDLKDNYSKVSYKETANRPKVVNEVDRVKTKSFNWKKVVKISVIAGSIYFFGMDGTVFASTFSDKAEKVYFDKFMDIAKWIIIGKGGWDIVTKTLKEDFDGAKRSILQYMLIFAVLMGLPWALNMVEDIFKEAA